MQQHVLLNAFNWREDWFPPTFYIRICPRNRLVDTMDVFTLVSSSHGASKTLRTKFLGARAIEESKQKYKFTDVDYRTAIWNNDKAQRKTLPIDIMISILNDVQTPVAAKLVPDFKNALDKVVDGALVVRNSESGDSCVTTAGNNGAVTHDMLPCFHSPAFTVNPYISAVSSVSDQVGRAGAYFELQKIQVLAWEHGNDYRRREEIADTDHMRLKEIADAEHVGKKAKIAAEADNQEWKLKLSRLNDKYEWATSKNKVQLASHIEKLIEEL